MSEFRAPEEWLISFRRRAFVAGAFVLCAFLLIGARLWHLQVTQYEELHSRAESNRIAVMPMPPQRREIVDRHGDVLARNFSAWTVEVNPAQVKNVDETLAALAEVVPFDERDRKRFYSLLREYKY